MKEGNVMDVDAGRTAVAFARAFMAGDAVGANEMFVTLPAGALPGFVSVLAVLLQSSLEVGGVDQDAFFAVMNEKLESKQ